MAYRYPDTIEIRFKNSVPTNEIETLLQIGNSTSTNLLVGLEHTGDYVTQGNINLYLRSGSTYISTSISESHIFDNEYNQLFIERNVFDDSSNIEQTFTLHLLKSLNGVITANKTSTISVDGTLGVHKSTINDNWNVDNTLYVAYANNPINSNYFTGEIHEVRLWHNNISDDIKIQHVLNGDSYAGNTPTSSYNDLLTRIPLNDVDVDLETNTTIESIQPNRSKNKTYDDISNVATIYGLDNDDYVSYQKTYYQYIPDYGPFILDNDKVEFVDTTLASDLNIHKRVELEYNSRQDLASNRIRVALSPTDIVNNDIFNHSGFFSIDDFIGNPEDVTNDYYTDLNSFSKEYWKKYSKINSFDAYYNILRIFDYSLFQQIKQVLPARTEGLLGVLYEPSILERSKQRAYKSITNSVSTHDADLNVKYDSIESNLAIDLDDTIVVYDDTFQVDMTDYVSDIIGKVPNKTSGELTFKFDMDFGKILPYASTYSRNILLKNDGVFFVSPNSEEIRDAVVEEIIPYKSQYGFYDTKKYKYSNDDDLYNGIYQSYTYEKTDIKTPYSTSDKNNRYNGSKLLNVPHNNKGYPTPDNTPVIEEYDVEDDSFSRVSNDSDSFKL